VGGEEADLSNDLGVDVYRLLKSPVRREIILLLHSRGELTAAQLKNLLNISYGTLYYHLDFLSPLIMQVGRGRYVLNDRGVRIAKRLLEEMGDERIGREQPSLGVFEKIAAHPIYFLPIGAISAGVAVIASAKLPLAFTILFLTPSENGFHFSVISLAAVLVYVMIVGNVLGVGEGGYGGLISSCLISYLPIDLYLLAVSVAGAMGAGLVVVFKAGFVIAHIAQLMIISAGLSYSRGVPWERSLLASLLLSYVSLLASRL